MESPLSDSWEEFYYRFMSSRLRCTLGLQTESLTAGSDVEFS